MIGVRELGPPPLTEAVGRWSIHDERDPGFPAHHFRVGACLVGGFHDAHGLIRVYAGEVGVEFHVETVGAGFVFDQADQGADSGV